jgi:hypothetical protein
LRKKREKIKKKPEKDKKKIPTQNKPCVDVLWGE